MKIEGLIKNVPNTIFGEDYAMTNHICFMMAKKEYSLVKYLRKKMLAGEITSDIQLEENIKKELKENYSGSELMGVQFMLNQVIQLLATSLNNFDKKKNNKFEGYSELEQYHSISGLIVNLLPALTMEYITNKL